MARETRESAKKKTRLALVQAGAELFAEQGLDGPSLDAICQRAGRTRGAFYVHFRDRDDFLAAVMEHVGEPLLDVLLAAGEGDEAFTTIAARFLRAVGDGTYPLTPQGGVRPHQLLDACARSDRVRELYVKLIGQAIDQLKRAVIHDQAGKTLRDDVDPESLATVLLAAVIGAQTMMELGAPVDINKSAAAIVRMLQPASPSSRKRRDS